MTLSQIQCFLIVSEKLNITEAANVLCVTQPAVSHRINKLEQELGTELFKRDKEGLKLTFAGKKYVQLFQDFIAGMEKISREIEAENAISENIVIGCADGWDISDIFIETRERLKKEYPGISIRLECSGLDDLIDNINNRKVDIAIGMESIFYEAEEMEVAGIKEVQGRLILSADHPLAQKENLSITDFREYPFYMPCDPKHGFMAADLVQYSLRHGFTPKVECVNSLSAVFIKIKTENGILIADEFLMKDPNQDFKSINVGFTRNASIGMRRDASKACRAVQKILLAVSKENWIGK